jgi:wyosine [tRNA(Phe)-imidazoG37] synthetase (radical SAM superfamily)
MPTFLFNEIIFGPINSRRLGTSLGINLLPTDYKFCTFNCVYCECGWTLKPEKKIKLPARNQVKTELEKVLRVYSEKHQKNRYYNFCRQWGTYYSSCFLRSN